MNNQAERDTQKPRTSAPLPKFSECANDTLTLLCFVDYNGYIGWPRLYCGSHPTRTGSMTKVKPENAIIDNEQIPIKGAAVVVVPKKEDRTLK